MSLHDPDYVRHLAAHRATVADKRLGTLQAEAKQAKSRADAAVRTAQKAMQERDALRAECDALRAALLQMRNAVRADLNSEFNSTHPEIYTALKSADAAIDNERSKA